MLPGELRAEPVARLVTAPHELVERVRTRLAGAHALVRLQRQRMLEQREARNEERPEAGQFALGDRALVYRPGKASEGQSRKLSYSWVGPLEVVAVEQNRYQLQHPTTGRTRWAHADHMVRDLPHPALPSDRKPLRPWGAAPPEPAVPVDIAEGDMLILALPDDAEPWRLARAEAPSTPQGTCVVHFYARTVEGRAVSAANWRPVYYDPDTGKDTVALTARGRLEPYIEVIPTAAVLLHPVELTATGRIAAACIRELTALPSLDWRFVRRRDPQLPDLPAPGARVAQQFEGTLYEGVVVSLHPPEGDDEPPEHAEEVFSRVRYTDGDVHDYTRQELEPLLALHATSDFRHLRGGVAARG